MRAVCGRRSPAHRAGRGTGKAAGSEKSTNTTRRTTAARIGATPVTQPCNECSRQRGRSAPVGQPPRSGPATDRPSPRARRMRTRRRGPAPAGRSPMQGGEANAASCSGFRREHRKLNSRLQTPVFLTRVHRKNDRFSCCRRYRSVILRIRANAALRPRLANSPAGGR